MSESIGAALINRLVSCAPDVVADEAETAIEALFGSKARIWVLGFGMHDLHPLDGSGPVQVRSSLQGRAILDRSIFREGDRCFVPLTARQLLVGILEVADASAWSDIDMKWLAEVVGCQMRLAEASSDRLAVLRGAADLKVAATIQYDMLPPMTYSGLLCEIAGRLEPADDIAGDGFDYSISDSCIDMCVFDASGHGLEPSLHTLSAIGAYRRARRRDMSMVDMGNAIEDTVVELTSDTGRFVAGVLMRLDLETKTCQLLNAGHLRPAVIRNRSWTEAGELGQNLPFGLGNRSWVVEEIACESDDVIALFTDGIIEAKDPEARAFGLERLLYSLSSNSGEITLERTVENVIASVVDHVAAPLSDDATLILTRI